MYGKITKLFKSALLYKSLPLTLRLVLSIGVDYLYNKLLGNGMWRLTFVRPSTILHPFLEVIDNKFP